ncbi:MAG TPA: DUF302 domain-containing protein [Acidimicrobiales bacterium]|nr:DUF302 domain-containing protein [Acidimicrobiales bacterium]
MTSIGTSSALETVVEGHMVDAEAAVRAALGSEGFGVLTEIDVAAIFRAKLGVDRRALKILSACNPSVAHQALDLDPSLALVLPCNVVLEDAGDRRTRITIADPRSLLGGTVPAIPGLGRLAEQAAAALERALAKLGS